MVSRVICTPSLLALPLIAKADDVIFSAAKVIKSHGSYIRKDPAHLYRWTPNGNRYRPLTAGPMDDTDPCLSPDGKTILFWRRDNPNLVGRSWLCSIKLDGTGFQILRRVAKQNMESPLVERYPEKSLVDIELPGIPSSEGGTDTSIDPAQMQDGTYAYGFYTQTSLLALATSGGKPIGHFQVTKTVNGKKFPAAIFGSEQWQQNPGGAKAFWFGPGRHQILLQNVVRTENGGQPTLIWVSTKTASVQRTLSGFYLQDVDQARTSFLTTGLRRGSDPSADGAVPLQTLLMRSPDKTREIGPPNSTCLGACFVRTTLRLPARPAPGPSLGRTPSKGGTREIVFAAQLYNESLGNVYPSRTCHLYRMRSDGTGLVQLTRGKVYDSMPCLDQTGKHILFWRGSYGQDETYRLYSIDINGGSLRAMGRTITSSPQLGITQAILANRPFSIKVESAEDGSGISIFSPRHKEITHNETTLFCPDGRHAIVRDQDESSVVDIRTGKQTMLASRWRATTWLGNDTIVALTTDDPDEKGGPDQGRIAYLTLTGKVRTQKAMPFVSKADESIWPESRDYRSVALRDPQEFLWVMHHWMSDGGYDYIQKVSMRDGKVSFLANQTLDALSPDRRCMIGTEYAWVGGYKGEGSAKLATMYLWDLKTGAHKPLGFRRMTVDGACFLPSR